MRPKREGRLWQLGEEKGSTEPEGLATPRLCICSYSAGASFEGCLCAFAGRQLGTGVDLVSARASSSIRTVGKCPLRAALVF